MANSDFTVTTELHFLLKINSRSEFVVYHIMHYLGYNIKSHNAQQLV